MPRLSPGLVETRSLKATVAPGFWAAEVKAWRMIVSMAAPSALAPYSCGWCGDGTKAATASWFRTVERAFGRSTDQSGILRFTY
ncbi:hypothetical protein GCM10011574_12350 [Microbispora bryophytorum]|uniref:Uncharacterized protein n=1 Tax=Microbispora bryophytorum TaxID=1460882 RepID=A0A8H9H1A9_9ACTN|nr:hypothetical protein GCM10011574_12350 [Microbispora bryophytorum]